MQPVARFPRVLPKFKLYPHRIETKKGVFRLTPDVTARVETAGALEVDRRVTGTRLILTGPFAFGLRKKRKHDHRELYLWIDTPEGQVLEKLDPRLGNEARKFAARVTSAARAVQGQPVA